MALNLFSIILRSSSFLEMGMGIFCLMGYVIFLSLLRRKLLNMVLRIQRSIRQLAMLGKILNFEIGSPMKLNHPLPFIEETKQNRMTQQNYWIQMITYTGMSLMSLYIVLTLNLMVPWKVKWMSKKDSGPQLFSYLIQTISGGRPKNSSQLAYILLNV